MSAVYSPEEREILAAAGYSVDEKDPVEEKYPDTEDTALIAVQQMPNLSEDHRRTLEIFQLAGVWLNGDHADVRSMEFLIREALKVQEKAMDDIKSDEAIARALVNVDEDASIKLAMKLAAEFGDQTAPLRAAQEAKDAAEAKRLAAAYEACQAAIAADEAFARSLEGQR